MTDTKTVEFNYDTLLVYRWLYLHGYVDEDDVADTKITYEIMGSNKRPVPLPHLDQLVSVVDNALDNYASAHDKVPSEKRRKKDFKRILRRCDWLYYLAPFIAAGIACLIFWPCFCN